MIDYRNLRCRWDERPFLCRMGIHRPFDSTEYPRAKVGPGGPPVHCECRRCGYTWWAPGCYSTRRGYH